jgi:hypothetical protein
MSSSSAHPTCRKCHHPSNSIGVVAMILPGTFFAYLPFSHLMRIITAPMVLAMRAASKDEHKQ